MSEILLPWDELSLKLKESLIKEYSLDSLQNKFPDKSIAFFEKEKKIFNLRPRFKDEDKIDVNDIENPPSLKIIKNRSLLISPEMALIEFLDNIFDNYIKNLKRGKLDHPLKIEIIFYEVNNQNTLLIRENSGGIHPNDIIPLVKPGESGNNDTDDMIGTWGEAFLYSCYSLGTDVTIYSYHKEGKPFAIPIDQNFFNSEKWVLKKKVSKEFDGIKNLDKGWTIFEINNAYQYTTNEITLFEELKAEIENTYWKKASQIFDMGHNVTIAINPFFSEELKVEFDFFEINKSFSHYPYCLPIFVQDYKMNFTDDHGKKGSILVDAYCGINPYDKDHRYAKFKGVCMWGNGRLFEKNRKDTSVGYNISSTGIRLEHRSLFNHLSILLFFKSNRRKWNKYIPWKIPTKKGFNSESVLKNQILDLIKIITDRFIYPLDKLLGGNRFIFELFSYDFIDKADDEKFQYILDEIKKSQNRDKLYPDIDWRDLSESKKDISILQKKELMIVLKAFFKLESESIHKLEIFEGNIKGMAELKSINIEFEKAIKAFNKLLEKSGYDPGYLRKTYDHFIETGFLPKIQEEVDEEKEKEKSNNIITSDEKKILTEVKVQNEKDNEFNNQIQVKGNQGSLFNDKGQKGKRKISKRNSDQDELLLTPPESKSKILLQDSKLVRQPKRYNKKVKKDISTKLQKSVETSKKEIKQIREQKETVSIKLELEKDNVRELKKKLGLPPNTSALRTIYLLINTFLDESN